MSDVALHRRAATEPIIRVHDLVTKIGGRILHDHLDLEVNRGEVLGVVGGSGSGKSVLLRTIIGLMRPVAGEIEVFGQDLRRMSEAQHRAIEARWGVLFQDGALFSSMTVAQNVGVPLREQLHLDPSLIDEIAAVKVRLVGLPADACLKYPSELSGGMRKRAGLARALALDPGLLFLDEPTAGLDPIAASDFDALIRDLRTSLGLTVFMVTHDLDSLVAICDRVAVLVDKRLIIGTIDELLDDPNPWIQAYFRGPRGRAALSGRNGGNGE
ncbi:MAG TPA: ATP-binding cassette domain-containing protein [Stellaceae bacterium]|nr:ATP-binding cassette domain-containing protein [Stellaceae bacterium]